MPERKSAEGFNLMLYRNEETGREEWLWNSRDGVTPFIITDAEDGAEMKHDDWFRDVFAPFYIPPVGSRIFVDFTEVRAQIVAVKVVDHFISDGVSDEADRDELIKNRVKSILTYGGGGAPDILTVNSAMQEEFRARRPAPRRTTMGSGRFA